MVVCDLHRFADISIGDTVQMQDALGVVVAVHDAVTGTNLHIAVVLKPAQSVVIAYRATTENMCVVEDDTDLAIAGERLHHDRPHRVVFLVVLIPLDCEEYLFADGRRGVPIVENDLDLRVCRIAPFGAVVADAAGHRDLVAVHDIDRGCE